MKSTKYTMYVHTQYLNFHFTPTFFGKIKHLKAAYGFTEVLRSSRTRDYALWNKSIQMHRRCKNRHDRADTCSIMNDSLCRAAPVERRSGSLAD